ncbi:MAG: TIGR00269 family protein [Nanoarchaeota archaeon]|nr:TIGR00269 family protein [Nanoarchaeota archaeon]
MKVLLPFTMCNNCDLKPVFKLKSGENLCKKCYLQYFEKKVRKTIRVHNLIDNNDKIGVAVSGGKDSLTILDLLCSIYKENPKIKIQAILIDEGIKDYRDKSIETAKAFCKEKNVPLKIISYQEKFNFQLDDVVEGRNPCSVCGVLRRNLLNEAAIELGVTKLATGHNLDDEAQSILMNQFRKNVESSARMGPITGINDTEEFVRRIKPLYFMSEKEVMTYAFLKNIVDVFNECPYSNQSFRNSLRDLINKFEEQYPGSKNAVVHSFLEILPLLKEKHKTSSTLNKCKECGGPTSKDICQKCVVLGEIKPN